MDNSEFAILMLEWESAQRKADELAGHIKAVVLAIGKTQVVGNVRATYSEGRRVFDYRAAVDNAELAPGSLAPWESLQIDYADAFRAAVDDGLVSIGYLVPFTSTIIDYAAASKGLKLVAPVSSQAEPSVTLKLDR